MHEEHRLTHVLDHFRRIEGEHALRPGRVGLLAQIGRHTLPPLSGKHCLLDFLLQLDLLRALRGRRLEAIERVLLLLEREVGSLGRWRVD